MRQDVQVAQITPVNRASLWLAAVGFLVLAIGSIGVGWLPTFDRYNFALQVLGPWLIAVALLVEWRTHVERRGWAAFIFFMIGILTFGALWIPYVMNPGSLGTPSATQLGFIMAGIASISASIGTFTVMMRKEAQLAHPIYSVEPPIKATFMQLLFFGLGTLLYGVDFIWVGDEETNHSQFSLLLVSIMMILIAVVSFNSSLTVQFGRPAVLVATLAVLLYALNYVLRVLPSWTDEEWRLGLLMTGVAYVLGAVASALAAIHKASAANSRLSPH